MRYVAGIDIGGTNVRCALAPLSDPARLLARRATATPAGGPDAFADFIAGELAACCRAAGVPEGAFAAVGCAAPGITDPAAGHVFAAANLGWEDAAVGPLLERRLGRPAAVENDVKAAAVGEYRYGAGRGCTSLVYLTVSTGVSAGIIVDGKVVRGFHHAAGEVGCFVPEPTHLDADWGANGCLELTAAGVGLARQWAAQHGGPDAPAAAAEVFAHARAGDAGADALVGRAADYLAQAAVAIGALLDPEVLVLGGSIAQHEPRIAARIRAVTAAQLPFPMRVEHATLGGDAPLVGALALAADRARIPIRNPMPAAS